MMLTPFLPLFSLNSSPHSTPPAYSELGNKFTGLGVEFAILSCVTRLPSEQRQEGERCVSLSGKSFHVENIWGKNPKADVYLVCLRKARRQTWQERSMGAVWWDAIEGAGSQIIWPFERALKMTWGAT